MRKFGDSKLLITRIPAVRFRPSDLHRDSHHPRHQPTHRRPHHPPLVRQRPNREHRPREVSESEISIQESSPKDSIISNIQVMNNIYKFAKDCIYDPTRGLRVTEWHSLKFNKMN